MDAMVVWNAILSLVIGIIGFFVKDKLAEVKRIDILLNKTREEIAREYVTNAEVNRITDHIDQRFNKLEEKIDLLIRQRG
jgi:histidinol phosphatase-like enzyme